MALRALELLQSQHGETARRYMDAGRPMREQGNDDAAPQMPPDLLYGIFRTDDDGLHELAMKYFLRGCD